MSEIKERFWAKVEKTDECWLWTASTNRQGYGRFSIDGRFYGAHRLAYEFVRGAIPPSRMVLHHCDNPGCVRPSHLWIGTQVDNMADRSAKHRQATGARNGVHTHPERIARGERAGSAKLTERSVIEIRRLNRAGGMTQTELSRRFGVGRMTIRDITRGITWKHVGES